MIRFRLVTEQALAYFGALKGALNDLTVPIARILRDVLSDAYLDVTASKGALYGEPWRPMVYFTVWFHRRDPSDLLHETGALAESLVPGGPGNIFEVGALAGAAGTSDRKAGWQQRGTSRTFLVLQQGGSRHRGMTRQYNVPGITPRHFLSWHPENFEKYAQWTAEHLTEAAGAISV